MSTGRASRVFSAAVLLTVILLATAASQALAATPTAPNITDIYPSPTAQITIKWNASIDASSHSLTYFVYRSKISITSANVSNATTITSTSATSVVMAATSEETTQSYVWYYAVRARDSLGIFSNIYYAYTPNPHRYTGPSIECGRCHSNMPHDFLPPGSPEPKTEALCYACHGRADANLGASYADRSTLHVKDNFFDYAGQTAGSKHRNTQMTVADPVLGNRTCSACHYAHLSPYSYDLTTSFVASTSYPQLLTVQTGPMIGTNRNRTAYTRVSGPRNNLFCFACHGTGASVVASYAGGPSAFANSGGDHNQSAYDTSSAHGTPVIKSNDSPANNPAVQCLTCHNKHASPTLDLIDYRGSDTTNANLYGGAGICFACHSSASTETKVAAGFTAPFSWNDRDVKAEFARTSRHPFSTTDTAQGSLRCANCHNTHFVKRTNAGSVNPAVTGGAWEMSRTSDPDNTTAFIADKNAYCLRCHDGSPPAQQTGDGVVVPFTPVFRAISAVTSPYFPGWNKSVSGLAFASSGHAVSAAGQKALCSTCHDPHASDFQRLTAWTAPTAPDLVAGWTPNAGIRVNLTASAALTREENLCYQCHGNGTTGKRATGAKDVATKAQLGNRRHDPANDTDIHRDTETTTNLAYSAVASKRHSECVDCHDPHVARAVNGSAVHATRESTAGPAVYGAWGVSPNYGVISDTSNWATPTAASYTPTRIVQSATSYEAYLCLKCHSNNTTIDSATYTNQALEFNPSNFSEHNVMGQSVGMDNAFTFNDSAGTARTMAWTIPAASTFLVTGWNANSKMTCTDCHDGQAGADASTLARGPHGSSVNWIIDPDYVTWSPTSALVTAGNGMSPSNIICAKCHTNLATANAAHGDHDGRGSGGGYCQYCHIKTPHGWKRPRMLGYTTDPLPYRTISSGSPTGLKQISVVDRTPTSWTSAQCNTGCQHTRAITPYWP